MKKTILGFGAIATLLCSCSDDWGVNREGCGYISPIVGIDTETVVSRSTDYESADSRAVEITADDLSLRLTSADGSNSWEWASVADFPLDKQFAVGEYTLEAFYGDVNEQGYECPAYKGSQNLIVADAKTTSLALTATLAKSMITIKYTDAFTNYMSDWSASVNGIEYTKNETRPVYVKPGDVSIKISITKPNGLTASFTLDNVAAKERHHYTITVDVNNGGVGDASLTVDFDDNMDVESVEIDLSDKLLSAPEPIVTPEGFEQGSPIELVEGIISDKELSMSLVAIAGIKGATLKTNSKSLSKSGWPEEIDLMTADAAMQSTLTSLGLDVLGLWKTPGEMAIVDFTGVAKHLKVEAGDSNVSTFTLTVKDKLMRECEPVTLTINLEEVQLELASAGTFFEPGANLDVKLGFNGGAVKENVVIEYRHPIANVWRPLEIINVSEAVSRSMYDYTVTIETPEFDGDLVLRAKCGNKISDVVTFGMAPFIVEANDTNVFATHAYVTVVASQGYEAPALDNIAFYAKKNGESEYKPIAHTLDNYGYSHITELEPNSEYSLKVRLNGLGSKATLIHTEAATQLENSDMESWSYQQGSSNHWGVYSLAGWNTLNLLTTSEGSDYGLLGRGGAGYVAKSGTMETDQAYSGSAAALIQTVGWGSNNSSGYTLGPSVRCDNITPGELYLGQYNATSKEADYGISFASRPAGIKFAYKYEPKNPEDYGVAVICILADDDSEIAKQEIQITQQDEYTEKTVELPNSVGMQKAAKLIVSFKSSGNESCLTLNTTNFTYPQKSRQTDSGFIGSKLYVDDIKLIY